MRTCFRQKVILYFAVLRIRIDPELLPGSGSGIVPDPAKNEIADE